MTIRTSPSRTTTPVAPARSAPEPLIVAPGTIAPGRARGRRPAPPRGPGEAHRRGEVRRRPRLPGRLVRRDDPLDRRPRPLRRRSTSTRRFDWSKVVVVTAADIPGENVVSLISDDQPVLVPIGGEIQHHAEPLALLAAPDRETLRAAQGAASRSATDAAAAGLRPARERPRLRPLRHRSGRPRRRASPTADLVLEGEYRVGHQEQLYIENNAMIAVPGEDGGVAVHGSLQCPYYVHKALKRALAPRPTSRPGSSRRRPAAASAARRSTPRSSPSTRRCSRARRGKPVRMIYDRHEDIAATTKRHPAIVRHRTGVTRDGTLVAQDIEVVMDGGAYCTLTPVVLSRGALHAGGPYRCPNVRIRGRATRDEHAAQRRVPRLRRAADRVRRRDRSSTASPRRSGMSARSSIRRRNVYRDGRRRRRPARSCARASPARRSSSAPPRRPSSSASGRGPARAARGARGSGHVPGGAAPDRAATGRVGHRPRARLARRRVHRLAARSSSRQRRVGRARPATARIRDPDRARPRWARGRRRSSRSSSPASSASPYEDVEIAPQDTAIVPDSGPDRREPDGDGRRRAADQGRAAAARPRSRSATAAGRSPTSYRADAATHGAHARRPAVRAVPGRRRSTTRPTAATPTRPSAGRPCVATVDVDLDTRRGHGPRRRRGRRRRQGDPPGPGRGPGRGRHAPGGRLRDDRGDQAARRPLPERPPRDVPHPDRARRAADHDRSSSRRRSAARRTARRASASCRWTSARRRSSPRSTTRPASGSTTCRRRRSGSSRRSTARPAPSAARRRRSTGRVDGADRGGTDPRPDARPIRSRCAAARSGRAAMTACRFPVNGEPVEVDVPGHAPAARRPARGPRPDRHEGGLRRGRVRRLLGARSTARSVDACLVPSARSTGAIVADRRGPRRAGAGGRGPRPAPAGVPRERAARSAASARRAC